jgi:thiamine monophosphate synthase
MKLFAITPDTISIDHLIAQLPEIRKRGATHLYLRQSGNSNEIRLLTDAAAIAGILPVVSYTLYRRYQPDKCGVHYKSSELNLLGQQLPARPLIVTVSTHSSAEARFALKAEADYVYVSPVYEPLSKHDERRLFPHADLRKLIAMYGERIVLLGGMTAERIKELAGDLKGEFSAAGITYFFNNLSV